MKFGIRVPNLVLPRYFPRVKTVDFDLVKAWTVECERLGFHSVWLNDHIVFGSILECWTTLSALATITDRIRLGPLVLCNNFRHPSLVAKMAATLDVISGGRLEFGLGAGWHEVEHRAYGLPLPSPRVRMERLEEALQIIIKMWTEDTASYAGKYYQLDGAECDPRPVQQPYPPIMVGSSGEKVGLRLVAKYADKYNVAERSLAETKRKLQLLKRFCAKVGRDYDDIEKSWWGRLYITEDAQDIEPHMKMLHKFRKETKPFEEWSLEAKASSIVGTPEDCIKKIRAFMELGITFIIVRCEDAPNMRGLNLLTNKVIPTL